MAKERLSLHILPNASVMIGVCMTVISFVKVIGLHNEQHRMAEIFAFDALIFLVSSLFSYYSIRVESEGGNQYSAEKIADVCFMLGLIVMTISGFLLTYEII